MLTESEQQRLDALDGDGEDVEISPNHSMNSNESMTISKQTSKQTY